MIFEDISFLEGLKNEEIIRHFSTKRKSRSDKKLFRSNMMLNPLKLKHLNRIDDLPADMITLNLEDGISKERKKEALYKTALFLSHLKSSKSFIIVRVNPIDEGGIEEIEFLNDFSFDAIRVSKVKTPKDMERVLKILDKDKEFHISLETKEAFGDIKSLKTDKRFTTANLGILDLLNSLNLPQSLLCFDNPTIDYILSKFLIDCKSSDILPISFMYQDYKNIDEFTKWCEKEKKMGFECKACLGPAQVEIANRIFSLTDTQIERAEHIVKLFETNSKRGINGFMDERYGFIDEPIYKDALLILKNALKL